MTRVTLKDIAKRVGLSKNTVSLALRNDAQIPARTRERIQLVAKQMGYQPNETLSQLMAQLRISQSPRHESRLAIVNAHPSEKAFTEHPSIPSYVAGCQRRATELGYALESYWLHDPKLEPKHWMRQMRQRNVQGLLIVGLMFDNRLPPQFRPVWEALPAVVTGVRTHDPALTFSCVDHHHLALSAFHEALALGYQRPALVIERRVDLLVDARFAAGFLTAQQTLPNDRRVPPFLDVSDKAVDVRRFIAWYDQHRPDVLLTFIEPVLPLLQARKLQVPRDVGVIQFEWRPNRSDLAGMNQHSDRVGEAAVDLLISQIYHHEVGVQPFPRASLISATWVPGPSVRSQPTLSKSPSKSRG
jgi:LacI family transcriptional regulator